MLFYQHSLQHVYKNIYYIDTINHWKLCWYPKSVEIFHPLKLFVLETGTKKAGYPFNCSTKKDG